MHLKYMKAVQARLLPGTTTWMIPTIFA